MGEISSIFKKHGGFNLIKQYIRSGVFVTAIGEILLLGKNKTALEIMRLATQFKIKKKLFKKYKKKLQQFDLCYHANGESEGENSGKVWVCWFQGIENAPLLVQKCYQSLKENLYNREIVLITYENMSQYVEFPDYILQKWKSGRITNTFMTDLLRLELLTKYGGMWIDATVLCTEREENIPNYFFDSDLFFFQCLKPGKDGHSLINSSWLISAKSNNKILMAVKFLCYEYWRENEVLIDYFLLHDFMAIVLEYYPENWKMIIPKDNATPHILLLRLFDKYQKEIWEAICAQTPFHKLTYKFSSDQSRISGTFYDVIFNKNL